MKHPERDEDYLDHIIESIDKIESYLEEYKKAGFYESTMVQDAVIRNLEIVGEAVSQMSQVYKDLHSHIPWRQISGMRNRLIHGYNSINMDIVWSTTEKVLPEFKKQISNLKQRDKQS